MLMIPISAVLRILSTVCILFYVKFDAKQCLA